MKNTIITKKELYKMFDEIERSGKDYLDMGPAVEIDGLWYSTWIDTRNGKRYNVREIRSVHMGFNSNEEGKLEEFVKIVEKEGVCHASWGVTGRTMHEILAYQLKKQLPQYRFEIGYNYECTAYKN